MSDETVNLNPYAEIFVSGDSLDRQLLARTASAVIQIYDDGHKLEIAFKSGVKLSNKQKILAFLLGRKILKDSGRLPEDEEESVTPSQIEDSTRISGGSIRPVLKQLLEERLVQKHESSYFVPNYVLEKVSQELQEKES